MATEAKTNTPAILKQLPAAVRNKPLSAFRVVFFLTVWTLTVANAVIVSREFQDSLPFVLGARYRRPLGIEDPRRQALPVLLAASIVLVVLIPFAVGLPLFGVATFLSRYMIEGFWSSSLSLLLLGGAAALSPRPTSPLLPRRLQNDLSASLALSFIILILLTIYNILLLSRMCFLLGKGTQSLSEATVFALLDTDKAERSPEKHDPGPNDNYQPENGSAKSGWDDEESMQQTKIEKRLAKAKSILTSPLKQAHFRT